MQEVRLVRTRGTRIRERAVRALDPRGRSATVDAARLRVWDGAATIRRRPGQVVADARRRGEPPRAPAPTGGLSAEVFREHVVGHLLPFWARHSVDADAGGFLTALDRTGAVTATTKWSAMQARMVFAFSAGVTLGFEGARALADRGVEFLADRMWDEGHGGWYAATDRAGAVVDDRKQVFDQAYVVTGLTAHAAATADARSLELAVRTYELLEERAWQRSADGYLERAARDWSVVSADRTVCVHLDVLAASLALHRATGDAAFLDRATRLAELVADRFVDRRHGCVVEVKGPAWAYRPSATRDVVEVGHNFKAARHLLTVADTAGRAELVPVAERIVDWCLQQAWDHRYGGLYHFVHRNGVAASRSKFWWSHCEALPTLLTAAGRGDVRAWHHAGQVAAFCFDHFADREHGEWFTSCDRDGTPRDVRKGSSWKAGYHTVDACLIAADRWDAAARAVGAAGASPARERS